MKEQTPHPRDLWNVEALEEALGTPAVRRLHAVHGEGYAFYLGDTLEPHVSVDLFPETGLVRYQGEGISLAIAKAEPLTTDEPGVAFNASTPTEIRSLFIGTDGELTLFLTPRTQPPTLPAGRQVAHPPETPRETLSGRLTQDPVETLTRHKAPMTRLSIRQDGEEASREVFAFGALGYDAGLYFHEGGEYTLTVARKTVQRNGEPEREIYVLEDMTIGKRGDLT